MFSFYKNKILNQWIEPSYSAFYSTCRMLEPAEWVIDCWYNEKQIFIVNALDHYQSIAYLMILIYFIHIFFCREDEKKYLPGLILIGGFLFSILWESKSRYIYPYIVFAMPCIAAGMKYCIDGIALVLKAVKTRCRNAV